ncbi:MAG: hypothetical protein Q8P57_04855 [Candidatus Pacearchaeota archaeon]|nr:hypothetical protein [Candidatus Pacearchaeota archaeon]
MTLKEKLTAAILALSIGLTGCASQPQNQSIPEQRSALGFKLKSTRENSSDINPSGPGIIFADIGGDGRPDRVYQIGGEVKYEPLATGSSRKIISLQGDETLVNAYSTGSGFAIQTSTRTYFFTNN